MYTCIGLVKTVPQAALDSVYKKPLTCECYPNLLFASNLKHF